MHIDSNITDVHGPSSLTMVLYTSEFMFQKCISAAENLLWSTL